MGGGGGWVATDHIIKKIKNFHEFYIEILPAKTLTQECWQMSDLGWKLIETNTSKVPGSLRDSLGKHDL